jgi:hypothetical protein
VRMHQGPILTVSTKKFDYKTSEEINTVAVFGVFADPRHETSGCEVFQDLGTRI